MPPAITETVHLLLQAAADELNRRGIPTASGNKGTRGRCVVRAIVSAYDNWRVVLSGVKKFSVCRRIATWCVSRLGFADVGC